MLEQKFQTPEDKDVKEKKKPYWKFLLILLFAALLTITIAISTKKFKDTQINPHQSPKNTEGVNAPSTEISDLLAENNIKLDFLETITVNPDMSIDFTYSDSPTGYTFVPTKRTEIKNIESHLWFDTYYRELLVFTTTVGIHISPDRVFSLPETFPQIPLSQTPNIGLKQASSITKSEQPSLKNSTPVLGYYDKNAGTGNKEKDYTLAWQTKGQGMVIIDAYSGEILYSWNGVYDGTSESW